MQPRNYVKDVLFGVAIGDALGVPIEFESREKISLNPLKDMVGYRTYNLPPGTFSDDSSLTFCLAEALTQEFNLKTIGNNFVKWYHSNYWTARGNVFDIGITTQQAIGLLAKGEQADLCGSTDINSNGNGSLMRIAPLVFYLLDKPINERYQIIKQVSSITHRHIRSVIACFYYLEFAKQLIHGKDKFEIYNDLKSSVSNHLQFLQIDPSEIGMFESLLIGNIFEIPEKKIFSSGYVLDTLEASIWCLMNSDSYKDGVLKAVNLGVDSDTTGAVTGGLAGLLYGFECIPKQWLSKLARKDDITELALRLSNKFNN